MESARPAVAADLDTIAEISRRGREAMEDQRGGSLFLRREAASLPDRERVLRLIDDADDGAESRDGAGGGLVVVGCYDDVVFGYGVVEYETLHDGSLLARLTDFVVDGEIRGSGIGEAMMDLAVDRAREAGCVGIDSMALPGDRETKNFFESFGLKARLLTVHRAFDPADDDA